MNILNDFWDWISSFFGSKETNKEESISSLSENNESMEDKKIEESKENIIKDIDQKDEKILPILETYIEVNDTIKEEVSQLFVDNKIQEPITEIFYDNNVSAQPNIEIIKFFEDSSPDSTYDANYKASDIDKQQIHTNFYSNYENPIIEFSNDNESKIQSNINQENEIDFTSHQNQEENYVLNVNFNPNF
jgi:hypothetical protein